MATTDSEQDHYCEDLPLPSGRCARCGKPLDTGRVLGVNQHPDVLTGQFLVDEDGDPDAP